MKKKVPVVRITTPDVAGELAGLPLEATVAMARPVAPVRWRPNRRHRQRVRLVSHIVPGVGEIDLDGDAVPNLWADASGSVAHIYYLVVLGGKNSDGIDAGHSDALHHILFGGGSQDRVCGSMGEDHLNRGAGDDFVDGLDADDGLEGREGDDWLPVGKGDDI